MEKVAENIKFYIDVVRDRNKNSVGRLMVLFMLLLLILFHV